MSKLCGDRGEDLPQHRRGDRPLTLVERGEGITKNIAAAVQHLRGRGDPF